MPTKGSIHRHGNRDYIFGKSFFKENLVEKHDVSLTYNQCKDIILHANKVVADVIKNEVDGFKLPYGMGYLCVTKYTPSKPAINWNATKKIGKYVFHTNMHTDGYSCRIMWYRVGRVDNAQFHEVYKFKAMRYLSRDVSALFANGKNYTAWEVPDFIEKGRLENLYNKRFRPEFKS